jgi:hypothetical protein
MKYMLYFIFMSVPFCGIAADNDKPSAVLNTNKSADKDTEKGKPSQKQYCNKIVGCGDSCFLHCLGMLLCCKDTFCKKS